MTNQELQSEANFIINKFKSCYLNNKGLVSRTFPASRDTIFAHFDDMAPFFIYFKETDFLLKQIFILEHISFDEIVSQKGIIYSYRIDEYLGGLFAVFSSTRDKQVKKILDEAIKKTIDYFFTENNLLGTYNITNRKKGIYYYYWSSGILETFLEMSKEYPQLQSRAVKVVDFWLKNKFYQKHGLFPFRQTENKIISTLNSFFGFFRIFVRHYPGMAGSGFLNKMKCRAKFLIFKYFSSGNFAVLMKSNTTFVFVLIKLYQLTKDEKYKSAVVNWISTVIEEMYKKGALFGTYYPNGKATDRSLVNSFIFVDVLLDTYFFVERNNDYLDLAKHIIDSRLDEAWDNGLIPLNPLIDKNHIDNQVDFSVSVRRYSDLSGDKSYLEKSLRIMEKTLEIHKADNGYYSRVNSKGEALNKSNVNAIDPKYNALLLKGIINMLTIGENMYNNIELHDLFKDR